MRERIVSVVVPVFEDLRLSRCLEALERQQLPPGVSLDVVVVDNGSARAPEEEVARHPSARLLVEAAGGSYAARNVGVAAARGEIVAFTDSDCRPDPGWLATAVSRLDVDPGVAAVAGDVVLEFESGRPLSAGEWWEALEAFPQARYVASGFAVTANLVVRAEVLTRLRGFDDRLRSGGDVDFGERLRDGGFRLVHEPAAVVRHPARSSWREILTKARRTARGRVQMQQARGRSRADVRRTLRYHAKQWRRQVGRALRDPQLVGLRARAGYLALGSAYRLVVVVEALRQDVLVRRPRAVL